MTEQQEEETAGQALRELGAHMRRGSGLTLRRAGAWWSGDKAVSSLVLAAGGGLTALYPWLLTVEAGVFLVAAYTATEDAEQPEPEAVPVDLAQHTEWAVAAAHRDQRKGVHLAALLEQLHDDELCLDLAQPADLGRALRELGIPVNPQLKLAGTNSPGVRYDELATRLGRMPVLAPPDVPDLTDDNTSHAGEKVA